jgi:peptidoglycan/xylan/chitin deacetylase (PgdA/CDA1 family)
MSTARLPRLAVVLVLVASVASVACVPQPANRPSPTPVPPSVPPTAQPTPTPDGPTPTPSFVRPTATPRPTFMAYMVRTGDTLTSIARTYGTTLMSLAYWNRDRYPNLDPESDAYDPGDIRVGWTLLLIPNDVIDPEEIPPLPATPAPPSSAPPTASPAAGPSTIVSHGSRRSDGVALTLDLGGRLDPALDIMRWLVANRVPATIFPTGASASTPVGREVLAIIRANPDLFDLGNHSWNHPDFRKLTDSQIRTELEDTERVLRDGTGMSSRPWFRPPYGGRDAAVDRAVGAAGWRYTVMWDVDTIDWRPVSDGGPTAAQIRTKVRDTAQGGSIVLMHLGGWHTLEALPGIVADLESNGYRPVTLGEMFGE